MKLNDNEIEMVKNSINLRQKINGSDLKYDVKFQSIIFKLKINPVKLNRSEKSLLRGCLLDSEIRPKSNLNSRTELDLFLSNDDIKEEYNQFDLANRLMNKLRSKNDFKEHIFEPSFEKIQKIKKADKIRFSVSNSGNMYKLAFETDKKGGYRIDIENGTLNRYEKSDLSVYSLKEFKDAKNLLIFLEWYEMKNEETETTKILKEIAKKVCW